LQPRTAPGHTLSETTFDRRDGTAGRFLPTGVSPAGAVALLVLLAVLAFVLVVDVRAPQKDDVAWLLYVARKWLGGKRLYIDLVEVNPPLIIWIYAIPAKLGDWLHLAPRLVAAPFFAACVLGSAWWASGLLRGRGPLLADRLPAFGVAGTVLLLLPGVEFGQREHLLIAAMLPYLCLFARALDGDREPPVTGALAGVVAGLGIALKPTYVLALVLLELAGALRGARPFRFASVTMVATLVAYAAGVVLICPAYLQKAVPLALALYGGTDTPFWQLVVVSRRLLLAEVVALLLCIWARDMMGPRSSLLRHLVLTLTLFAIGSTLVFMAQGKDWFYHRLPAMVATVLALSVWLGAVLALRASSWRRMLMPVALAGGVLVNIGVADYDRLKPWVMDAVEPDQSTAMKLERLVKQEKAHTYIAFSEWIALGFPVVNDTGVTWASRFDSMWAIRGLLWRARRDHTAPKEWPISMWVARDFIAGCPDLAVVDIRQGINYVSLLTKADGLFADAWSHYHEIAAFDGLRVFKRDMFGCSSPAAPVKRLRRSSILAMNQ
jgi:hypothetical protein